MQPLPKGPDAKRHMRPVRRGDQNPIELAGMVKHMIRFPVDPHVRVPLPDFLLSFLIPAADTA